MKHQVLIFPPPTSTVLLGPISRAADCTMIVSHSVKFDLLVCHHIIHFGKCVPAGGKFFDPSFPSRLVLGVFLAFSLPASSVTMQTSCSGCMP